MLVNHRSSFLSKTKLMLERILSMTFSKTWREESTRSDECVLLDVKL